MARKLAKRIVGYHVASAGREAGSGEAAPAADNVVQMHEKLERPPVLQGASYKISTPLSEHALYVTINDIVLNAGTAHEMRRPFEMFINSKNMDHFQWIVALTRIVSAVFRKGGDVTFLVEELRSVFDPRGGYFKAGGHFVPSLVGEIGDVLEQHLREIGILRDEAPDPHKKAYLEQKRAEAGVGRHGFPAHAELCVKCRTKAAVTLDGCLVCLQCGDSKCS